MTPELTALTLAALLQVAQFALYAVAANLDVGPSYTMGSRDFEPKQEMSKRTARLGRAFENHVENLLLFAIAVAVIQLSGQNTAFTAACAYIYVIARALYIPAYAFGLNPARSIIWFVGMLATTLMLLAALV